MSLVWINGTLVDKSEAKISVFDHGFLYGDGVWEHFRAFGGKLFRPEKTFEQLFVSLGRLGIDCPWNADQLHGAILDTLRANSRTDGYIRVLITRGVGTIGPDPRKIEPQVLIIAEEYHPFPIELYGHGLHAAVWQGSPKPLGSLGSLHLVQAKREALRQGCLEAILLHGTEVIGGTEGGLFIVKDGTLRCAEGCTEQMYELVSEALTQPELRRVGRTASTAPAVDAGGPRGIANDFPAWASRDHSLRSWSRSGPPYEAPVSQTEFASADEVFLAGISCGIIGILKIDGRDIGTGTEGPVTKRIREAYRTLTRGS